MLLTIHNLPSSTRYADVKSLLKDKCGLTEVIVDNLVNEGKSKKVTVGLATEDDGAFVVRKLNGLLINGQQLYIEDKRRSTADQPYRPGGLDPVQPSPMMQPVMAPMVPSWNQTVAMPYMQPMAVDQTVVKSESNHDNRSKHTITNTHNIYIPAMFKNKEELDITPSFVQIKPEPSVQTPGRLNTNVGVKCESWTQTSDIKPNFIKIEPPDEYETMPHTRSHGSNLKKENNFKVKITKKEPNNDEQIDIKNVNKCIIKKEDLTEFKAENFGGMIPEILVSVSEPRSKKALKAESKARRSAAKMIAKTIMEIGREHFKSIYGVPRFALEKQMYTMLLPRIHSRLRVVFGDDWKTLTDSGYIYQHYGQMFGFEDNALYIDARKKSLKSIIKQTKPKKRERSFQNMVAKVKSEILSQPDVKPKQKKRKTSKNQFKNMVAKVKSEILS